MVVVPVNHGGGRVGKMEVDLTALFDLFSFFDHLGSKNFCDSQKIEIAPVIYTHMAQYMSRDPHMGMEHYRIGPWRLEANKNLLPNQILFYYDKMVYLHGLTAKPDHKKIEAIFTNIPYSFVPYEDPKEPFEMSDHAPPSDKDFLHELEEI